MTDTTYSGPTREQAWDLLCEYTKGEGLRKHALAVEATLGFFAREEDADETLWRITGLLHDFDYERWPSMDDHPAKGSVILEEQGYPDEMRRAIMGHADYSGVPRDSRLAKVLFACDELAGFVTAVSLVRPSKKVADVKIKSVKKKLKDKAFARQVSREDIRLGAEELGLPLETVIEKVIAAMQGVAEELGL
jgi:putative nucleotidyltransferase with HDIG domain